MGVKEEENMNLVYVKDSDGSLFTEMNEVFDNLQQYFWGLLNNGEQRNIVNIARSGVGVTTIENVNENISKY